MLASICFYVYKIILNNILVCCVQVWWLHVFWFLLCYYITENCMKETQGEIIYNPSINMHQKPLFKCHRRVHNKSIFIYSNYRLWNENGSIFLYWHSSKSCKQLLQFLLIVHSHLTMLFILHSLFNTSMKQE